MDSITHDFIKIGPIFALDLETAMAPDAFKGRDYVRLLQAYSPTHSFWYDLATFEESDWIVLKSMLEDPMLTIIGHNIMSFDIPVLAGCGINVQGRVEDTQIMSWMVTNGLPWDFKKFNSNYSLKATVNRELGIEMDKGLQTSDWMNVNLHEGDYIKYGMLDVEYTWKSYHVMEPRLKELGMKPVYETELKAGPPTAEIEQTGLPIDRTFFDQHMLETDATRKSCLITFIEELDAALMDEGAEPLPRHPNSNEINLNKKEVGSIAKGTKVYAGFNPGSSQQLIKRFADLDIHPVDKTGKPSVDKKLMIQWNHIPVVKSYMDWKASETHLTYQKGMLKNLSDDGRIRGRLNQCGTNTGRYSSSSPNLQNIPRGELRHAIAASDGRLILSVDYSTMELRALCSPKIANETVMADAFRNGVDVHRLTASKMFNISEQQVSKTQRQQAKAVNFGSAYGSSPQGLVDYFLSIGQLISFEEGKKFLDSWLNLYPAIARWHDECRELCSQDAVVRMVDGRLRWLNGTHRRHTVMCNNIVQGSCASAMKLAMYNVHRKLKKLDSTAKLIAQVHDELVLEVEEIKGESVLEMVKTEMQTSAEKIFGPDVPMIAEGNYGPTWASAKD